MKKRIAIALITLAFIVVIGASAALAAIRTVDNIADDPSRSACTPAANDCSLRGAIYNSAIGDTINFDLTLFATDQTIAVGNGYAITGVGNKNLVLENTAAGRVTLSAAATGANILQLSDQTMTIRNLTFASAYFNGHAGISMDGFNTQVTIERCVFRDSDIGVSVSTGIGGPFPPVGLTVTDSEFYNLQIGALLDGNRLPKVLTRTSFHNNVTAIQGRGVIDIVDSAIRDNSGPNWPGVKYYNTNDSGQRLNISGTEFVNNVITTPNSASAAALNTDAKTSITNSTFSGNSSSGGTIRGINTNGPELTVTNVTVTGNQTGVTNEGAINNIVVIARNSIIAGNTFNGNPTLTSPDITNCNFRPVETMNVLVGRVGSIFGLDPGSGNQLGSLTNPIDARLLPLANNGGLTRTHAPRLDSLARRAGTSPNLAARDQRGTIRPTNIPGDIGAYQTSMVYNSASSGQGSLDQIINDAATGDTIFFDAAYFSAPRTIVNKINIFRSLTIVGPGSGLLTVDAANTGRVLNMDNGVTVNVSGMRFVRGFAGSGVSAGGILINGGSRFTGNDIVVENCQAGAHGGGIYNTGSLTLTNSTIRNNTAGMNGGGIYDDGFLSPSTNILNTTISNNTAAAAGAIWTNHWARINNSTISGNTATGSGGAAYIQAGSLIETFSTTITNNFSASSGTGGIVNLGQFQAHNTILAGNRNANGSGSPDMQGVLTSYGYNLIGNTAGSNIQSSGSGGQTLAGNLLNVQAGLAPLANYGGSMDTHALLANSPAINAADPTVSFGSDERGAPRPTAGIGDIGAFERNIVLDQDTLGFGNIHLFFSQQLTATRQTGLTLKGVSDSVQSFLPAVFSIVPVAGESLPPGLNLSPDGLISGMPASGGTFTFTVKAADTDGMAGVQKYSVLVFAPTAAAVSISGRLLTSDGQGIRNATVVLMDAEGTARTVLSGPFGYFQFEDVPSGETFTLSVRSKQFQFAPRILSVADAIYGLEIVASP